jgi:DNA polymerase III epsilon subunit-like protein
MYKPKVIFCADCETSGLNWGYEEACSNIKVCQDYQSVQWGFVAVDATTLETLGEKKINIKWNGVAKWTQGAEKIHGLSKEWLEENGVTEEEAIVEMVEFWSEYVDLSNPIFFMGHHWRSFDHFFLEDLFIRHEVEGVKFSHKVLDTYSLAMGTLGLSSSDDIFKAVGLNNRTTHDALEDAQMTVEAFKRIRRIWKKLLQNYQEK